MSEAEEKASGANGPEGADRKWRVLCVDDDASVLRVFSSMLTRAGCAVTAQTSPLQALELLRVADPPFDLLLTDQSMPQLTGSALAALALQLRPDLPVVLVSGYADDAVDGAAAPNIRLRLQKPVLFQALVEAVTQVLGTVRP